ncbi:MAG: hypothetical protein HDR98_03475 [Bacteroides sp.]|nr:hypothetical protein [Bacteroides sp.]
MKHNFELTQLEEQISHKNTRMYFSEIISSYYNGNYRAAVTLLYSVVICDLVFKLQELRDIFSDSRAQGILAQIEKLQEANPTSPEWEKVIVDEMFASRYVVDTATKIHIEALRNERNLCAHPVLKYSYELFTPSKEAVYGHITNALTDVLTKSSLHGNKNMFENLIIDIEKNSTSFLNYKDLGKYLSSKYFNSIRNSEEEYRIFKKLWKLVFKLTDKRCNDNRKINRWTMYNILFRNRLYIEQRIREDIKVLQSQLNFDNKDIMKSLVRFLNVSPTSYRCFSPDTIQILNDKVEKFHLDKISLFKVNDIRTYVLGLDTVDVSDAKYITRYLTETDNLHIANQFATKQFLGSRSYDEADNYFDEIISFRLNSLTDDLLRDILEGCNNNGQIYWRRKSRESNNMIRDEINKRGIEIDWDKYPNLRF